MEAFVVKPICVIYYLPDLFTSAGGVMISVYDMNKVMKEHFPDYLTLAIPSHLSSDGSCEDVRLEVFHPKDFSQIQYDELKELILTEMDKLKQVTNPKEQTN